MTTTTTTAERVPATAGPLTEVALGDGTPAMIWPLLHTDGEALRQAYAELSPASRRFRFLTDLPELSDGMLRILVDAVDGVDHVAVVLTAFPDGDDARQVGVARLVRYPDEPEVADVAVTVTDAWQGRGVGRALMDALLARRPSGVVRLRTTVAAENRASLRMLGRVGRMTARHEGGGELTVEVTDLPPVP
ncbi:GNAT family N-acetyltransferase [Geodermatophilus amargosae]|uniref:GNAT family N-acetyltransferase n=1 Tax=Geodermatophilus amargosae TaxID=1296565 RepID=UPI001114E439|nr:GNAT family N-acetyltransferase [Geodermatophilus amargosae]